MSFLKASILIRKWIFKSEACNVHANFNERIYDSFREKLFYCIPPCKRSTMVCAYIICFRFRNLISKQNQYCCRFEMRVSYTPVKRINVLFGTLNYSAFTIEYTVLWTIFTCKSKEIIKMFFFYRIWRYRPCFCQHKILSLHNIHKAIKLCT